jgi:hypothetical protein
MPVTNEHGLAFTAGQSDDGWPSGGGKIEFPCDSMRNDFRLALEKGKLFECSFDGLRRCPLLTGMDWRRPRVNRTIRRWAVVENWFFHYFYIGISSGAYVVEKVFQVGVLALFGAR